MSIYWGEYGTSVYLIMMADKLAELPTLFDH